MRKANIDRYLIDARSAYPYETVTYDFGAFNWEIKYERDAT